MHSLGFTLFEIVIVGAIISVACGLSVFFGINVLREYAFHSDRDLLVSSLQHARADAIGNICLQHSPSDSPACTEGRPHGVHVGGGSIVIFQTSHATPDFSHRDASADAVIGLNPNTTVSGISDVVFSQLSGDVATPGNVTLTEAGGRTSVITIGGEGQIMWTN